MAVAAFIVASVCLALLGSYRYVETSIRCVYMIPLTRPSLLRLAVAAKLAIAITFVEAHVATAAARGAALRVLSRRNTGKLSWRNTVSKSDVK
jgi:hypothetical protein